MVSATVSNLRVTVSALQAALDVAHQRLREQQATASVMNQRYGDLQERAMLLEHQLANATARAWGGLPGAMHSPRQQYIPIEV